MDNIEMLFFMELIIFLVVIVILLSIQKKLKQWI
jgi:Sec-independent protein translocase protein TatA